MLELFLPVFIITILSFVGFGVGVLFLVKQRQLRQGA